MKKSKVQDLVSTVERVRAGKIYKSNGIWVVKDLYQQMKLGNAARDAGEWHKAVQHYRAAVELDSQLVHAWIQLGHAYHQCGQHLEGNQVYEKVLELDPSQTECYLHLGGWLQHTGDFTRAIEVYKKAYQFDELKEQVVGSIGEVRPSLGDFLRKGSKKGIVQYPSRPESQTTNESILCFDVSDLIAHYRHNKFPTGIQRVQIEIVLEALETYGERVEIFFFVDGLEDFVFLDHKTFKNLARLSKGDEQEEWVEARDEFFASLLFSEAYLPSEGAIVINLGTSWWMYNYFLAIRNLKHRRNVTFVSYVHDLIPVICPEYCVEGVVIDYHTWLTGAAFHADAFITNSSSTTHDLLYSARIMGHSVSERDVATIPLNASFSDEKDTSSLPSEAYIGKWGLRSRSYALFVSTIEARKNHEAAFLTWLALIKKHGAKAIPPLVCVGKLGWLNERAMRVIENNPILREKIIFITRASDQELKSLYRQSLFTVYPSHYEGWGLPITESLSYGRVPLVADNSSLVEAAGGFGVVFESGNLKDFVAKAEKLIFNPQFREELEREISAAYKLTTWHMMMKEIVAFSEEAQMRHLSLYARFPERISGRYVPMRLHRGRQIWQGIGSGEIYRIGDGWHWPEVHRCRIKPGKAEICVPNLDFDTARVFVHLTGLESQVCTYEIYSEDGTTVFSSSMQPKQSMWAVFNLPINAAGQAVFTIHSEESERVLMNYGGSEKRFSAGLSVLGFCISDRNDSTDRLDFLEGVYNNRLEHISFFGRS